MIVDTKPLRMRSEEIVIQKLFENSIIKESDNVFELVEKGDFLERNDGTLIKVWDKKDCGVCFFFYYEDKEKGKIHKIPDFKIVAIYKNDNEKFFKAWERD